MSVASEHHSQEMQEIIRRAVLLERERCAGIAEKFKPNLDDARSNQQQLADLIRTSNS